MLKNILVEEQILDEVAFQTRFMSSAARRSIMGYQPTSPFVQPNLFPPPLGVSSAMTQRARQKRSHPLLYILNPFASTSVKNPRFDPFHSQPLLKLTITARTIDMTVGVVIEIGTADDVAMEICMG